MSKENFRHGYYCVAYLDILGQRRKLRELARVPLKSDEARKLVEETACYVLYLRQQLSDTFERYKALSSVLDSLPIEIRKRIKAAKAAVQHHGVSDSLIMAVRFEGDAEQFAPMTGVFGCIAACCILHLVALAHKRPIRGGIDVSYGADITEEEVYGPVLESAIFLESKVADYPRIVIGDGLSQYLDVIERDAPATPLGKAARNLASRCKRYLMTDSDGFQMLDFLGDEAAALGRPEERSALFQPASQYIAEQKQIPLASDESYRHRARYFRLGAYFEKRAALWKL